MKVIELILDDSMEMGIDAISIVESPAIQSNFVALKETQKFAFATQNSEKRLLMGPALIPNKTIYRHQGGEEFYIFFSKDTIRKASERFFAMGNQNNATLEHQFSLSGMTIVESWIVDDPEMDKSRAYGLDMPSGTWMVSMKVWDDEVWDKYIMTGDVKGFSIEGYFADKLPVEQKEQFNAAAVLDELLKIVSNVKQ